MDHGEWKTLICRRGLIVQVSRSPFNILMIVGTRSVFLR